ncbi:hypothetical protein ACHAXT_010338 [Thalassiosira profunda]
MMAAPLGPSIGKMLASYGSDLEDEVPQREEDLRPSDVVFSARIPRYKNIIKERVNVLEEKRGNVEQWNKDELDQEAYNAVAELKEGGGRLLKPEGGLGNSPITGYSLMSDEDAVKRAKTAIKSRGVYLLKQQEKLKATPHEQDDESVFSDLTELVTTDYVTPNDSDFILSLTDDREGKYRDAMFRGFKRFETEKELVTAKSFSRKLFQEMKCKMLGQGGRYLKCINALSVNRKYFVVSVKVAENKVFEDVSRRNRTSHLWNTKRDSSVLETSTAAVQTGRKKKKTKKSQPFKAVRDLIGGTSSSAGRAKNSTASATVGNNDDPIVVDVDAKEDAKESAVVVVDLMQKAALYDAIREKLNQSTDLNEKKFYGGLKRHINEHFHKDLTSADLEKVQSYIADFETLLKRLDDESNDHDDILNAQKTIDMHMESLPLSN